MQSSLQGSQTLLLEIQHSKPDVSCEVDELMNYHVQTDEVVGQ